MRALFSFKTFLRSKFSALLNPRCLHSMLWSEKSLKEICNTKDVLCVDEEQLRLFWL